MIKTTTWRLDTCGCSFDYEWDDTLKEDQRVHTFKSVNNSCIEHSLFFDKDLYDVALLENTTKNIVVNEVSKIILLPAEEIPYTFDVDRKIIIDTSDLGKPITADEKISIENAIVDKVGLDKVIVL